MDKEILHKVNKNFTIRLDTSRMNFGARGKKPGSYAEKGNESI